MSKKMLIIRACGQSAEKGECNTIKSQAELYGMKVDDFCPKSNEELGEILLSLYEKNQSYDYIYLSSHGNLDGFGSEDESVNVSWSDFGSMLCNNELLEKNCVVMLSCCRAGLNKVAYEIFYSCQKVDYIVGPRQSLVAEDMLICFNILLYNLEQRNLDPIVCCEKIKLATDIRFICFDRLETVEEVGYLVHVGELSFTD